MKKKKKTKKKTKKTIGLEKKKQTWEKSGENLY